MQQQPVFISKNVEILHDILDKISRKPMDCQGVFFSNNDSIFSSLTSEEKSMAHQIIGISKENRFDWKVLQSLVGGDVFGEDLRVDRCLGCYFGMVLGDYLGAPVEFIACQDQSNSIEFVEPEICSSCVIYHVQRNVFSLETGQWTDDAAMGGCIADSLLVKQNIIM